MSKRNVSLFVLILGGFLTLSLIRGQERPGTTSPPPPVATRPVVPMAASRPAPLVVDPQRLEGPPRQFYLGAQRGAEWLVRINGANGRFLNGWVPSLNVPLEGDHFLRQAGAAFAVARAARLTGEDRYTACAARALLSLLDETVLDAADQVRYTPLPSVVVNRLGANALLVLAINELPAPPPDLLEKSEQMCNFIRRQARPDGSFVLGDLSADGRFTREEAGAVNHYPGQALYALARSVRYRPAEWKIALLRKAVTYYLPGWRANRNLAFVTWQTAAYAEAFALTRDRAFAEAVFTMSDWLIGLQYDLANNGQHAEWVGGFKSWADGRALDTAPTAQSACYGEALALATRVARQCGDAKRLGSYGESLLGCLQFIATLQYTEANTTHFVGRYREQLAGAFHASNQEGTIHIEDTQHAVSAMALFVELSGG